MNMLLQIKNIFSQNKNLGCENKLHSTCVFKETQVQQGKNNYFISHLFFYWLVGDHAKESMRGNV